MFESWKEREFEKKMERFRTALQEKNTILIGAGAGLSTSAAIITKESTKVTKTVVNVTKRRLIIHISNIRGGQSLWSGQSRSK